MPDQHATTAVMLPGAMFQAICDCGYTSRPTANPDVAEAHAEQHLAYVAEVEALKRAYPSESREEDR